MKDERRTKSELIRELKSLRRAIKRLETEGYRRKKPEEALRETVEKFRAVADFSADWEYWLDASGQFLYVSPSCEGITGYPPEAFYRDPKSLLTIVHPDDRLLVQEHADFTKKHRLCASLNFRIITRQGDVRWIGHRCSPVINARGKWTGTRGINRDITMCKRAEDAIIIETEMRNILLENLPSMAMVLRKKTREIVFSNESARRAGAVPGRKCYETFAGRDNPCPFCLAEEVWKTNLPRLLEVKYRGKYYEDRWTPLSDDLYVHYIFDITERINAEMKTARYRTKLRALTHRLVNTQEMERKEISRELHDEIGQALTAIKINLTEMGKAISPEFKPQIKERMAESDAIVDKMLEQIHEMSLDLHPAMLDDLGLVPTLRWYGKRFAKRVGVDVTIDAGDLPERMDSDLKTNLYRIIQEALTNVARHAHAKKVLIRLNLEHSVLQLSITDDGSGFEVKNREGDRSGSEGMGLLGMHERVAFILGCLEIESGPERGTSLLISVPWKGRENG